MKPEEVSMLIHAVAFCISALIIAIWGERHGRR